MRKYRGKEKCRILKQIRAEIAKQNDIEWVVSECRHQGDCRGTCPKCEYEVRQLEAALARRQALGKTVAVMGIAAGMALSVGGCANPYGTTAGEPMPETSKNPAGSGNRPAETDAATDVVAGGMILDETEVVDGEVLMGDPVLESETFDEPTAGVPMPPESEDETEIPLPGEVPDSESNAETDEDWFESEEPLAGEPLPPPPDETTPAD